MEDARFAVMKRNHETGGKSMAGSWLAARMPTYYAYQHVSLVAMAPQSGKVDAAYNESGGYLTPSRGGGM
ncbi:hypothetical protein G3M48_007423 [Beauveria asiatica]|uniref:Uncharacterized protein n=1 Tax=Beauveria asiatica TaxID=1069075 RepID=A0AAW0S4Y9_9HYPO